MRREAADSPSGRRRGGRCDDCDHRVVLADRRMQARARPRACAARSAVDQRRQVLAHVAAGAEEERHDVDPRGSRRRRAGAPASPRSGAISSRKASSTGRSGRGGADRARRPPRTARPSAGRARRGRTGSGRASSALIDSAPARRRRPATAAGRARSGVAATIHGVQSRSRPRWPDDVVQQHEADAEHDAAEDLQADAAGARVQVGEGQGQARPSPGRRTGRAPSSRTGSRAAAPPARCRRGGAM